MDAENLPIIDAITDLRVSDKRGLLHDLARRAAVTLKIEDDIVFNALANREQLGSTGVGNGVAIPHARLEPVRMPFGILARLREPIEFDAIDGQLVDLVCLLLLPTGPERGQLNSMASVARRLRSADVLRELRRAPNRAVLYNVMMGKATPSK